MGHVTRYPLNWCSPRLPEWKLLHNHHSKGANMKNTARDFFQDNCNRLASQSQQKPLDYNLNHGFALLAARQEELAQQIAHQNQLLQALLQHLQQR